MSGLGCNRKEKEKKERQGWGRRKEAVNKKKKKVGAGVGGGDDGVRGRFMGDVYYYTALPQGGEGRGVGREAKHSLSPSSSLATQKPHRGAKSFVSAVEEAGDVGFVLKC